MNDLESIWHLVCTYFQAKTTEMSYRSWITTAKPLQFTDNTLLLEVPSVAHRDYWNKNLTDQADAFLEKSLGEKITVLLKLPEEPNPFTIAEEEIKAEEQAAQSNYSDSLDFSVKTTSSNASESQLNEKYTFDTFVDGNGTRMAYAAALAVAEEPANYYNPLFIYGGVGLGKTHLMHSIAHFVLQKNPSAKVLYVTSEYFTNELIDSIRNGNNSTMSKFREKYRNIDVLLIDDIQFIIGKESTQEEFFHTFNALHGAKKQIVISSDKPPKDMEILEDRLRSRFEWGLIVDISSPDYETRMAILRKKEELDGYKIDDEVIEYIAKNVKSNIRELEGSLNKIMAYANLEKSEINLALAEKVLKDIISPNQKRIITPELIIEVVAEHFDLQPSDLTGNKRNAKIVFPRQIVMYLCRNMTEVTLKNIGKVLGGRDHTTIMNGIDKIEAELNGPNASPTQEIIDILKKKINPSK